VVGCRSFARIYPCDGVVNSDEVCGVSALEPPAPPPALANDPAIYWLSNETLPPLAGAGPDGSKISSRVAPSALVVKVA
jgi:hypothetical protein